MISFRVFAIPTKVASLVLSSQKSPGYGHPAYTETAAGYGPCRHCLQTFHIGKEQRTLFTYDPFHGLEQVPLPGPIFIHTLACERYPEESGYPSDLLHHSAVMNGYSRGQVLVAREYVDDQGHEATVERLLQRMDVDYIEVRDKAAGCFDFRIERARLAAEDGHTVMP